MTTYIIYSFDVPLYKIKADFYDVENGFISFYDDKDNLIGSFNADEVNFIIDLDRINNVIILNDANEKREYCDYKEQHKDDNFDELFKRVMGIHGKE